MTAILMNLRNAVIVAFVLALVLFAVIMQISGADWSATFGDRGFWAFVVRWFHIIAGVMWIGLLYYFNFVAAIQMPKIPDNEKPTVGKYITPTALFWFRWAAMATVIFGLILGYLNDYLTAALTLGATEKFAVPSHILIGVGAYLGVIMWFNVWFVIWPNQQKALNIGNRYPDLAKDAKAAAAKTAGMFSRINVVLSVPMLFAMAGASHLGV